MNILIISIGSNVDSDKNIKTCRTLLHDIFENIYFSETSTTTPYGNQYKNQFTNQLALVHTDQKLEDCIYNLKLIEKQIGRKPNEKAEGMVRIDADVVKCNDTILKQEDWERSYVADLLPSLFNNALID